MGHDVFKTILNRKIDNFVATFSHDAPSIYKDGNNKLIHPGEYGMYRERSFKELLRFLLPKNLSISDGFIINSLNRTSTQCDVIIYDSGVMPMIDDGIANFSPMEIVKSFGEVKSDLSATKLKEALIKLAEVKMLFSEISSEISQVLDIAIPFTSPFSFLVCKK